MSSEQYICCLPKEVQTYAKEVLNETEQSRKSGFEEIRKWAEENVDLHVRTDEKYILPFLRVSKFDLQKTKEKLRDFYTMRRDRTEWFVDRNPGLSEIQDLVKIPCFSILKRTSENQLVVIVRPTIYDPKIYDLDNVVKSGLMLLDVAVMEEELAQIYGVIAVIDMQNVSFGHAKQMTPARIKNLVHSWQNFHCRPKRIEFVNAPSYINIILDIFKTFMTPKLRRRTHVCYSGFSSLAEIIDIDVLPQDYGGNGDTLEELGKYWSEKLCSYSRWFAEEEKYKAEKEPVRRNVSWFFR